MIRRDDGGRTDRGPEWVVRPDDFPPDDDAIGVRQRRETGDIEWSGLGADQHFERAPFYDDAERDAYHKRVQELNAERLRLKRGA